MKKNVLLIHGWCGNGEGHWMNFLGEDLKRAGHNVAYPSLPDSRHPKMATWVEALKACVESFDTQEDFIVVGHSLGPVAWMHLASTYSHLKPSHVFMVAPVPSIPSEVDEVKDFYPVPNDWKQEGVQYSVIASDNDPFISFSSIQEFIKIYDLQLTLLKGQGHINVASGYGRWPLITELCLKAAGSN